MAKIGCSFRGGQGSAGSSRGSGRGLLLVLLLIIGLHKVVLAKPRDQQCRHRCTHVVAGLLVLVALLVRLGLCLIRLALLGIECLPSLTEDLADLT